MPLSSFSQKNVVNFFRILEWKRSDFLYEDLNIFLEAGVGRHARDYLTWTVARASGPVLLESPHS